MVVTKFLKFSEKKLSGRLAPIVCQNKSWSPFFIRLYS